MKRLTWIIFVIALIIVAYETFRPQPKFPQASAGVGSALTVAAATINHGATHLG